MVLGSAAISISFGETAALTVWAPHLIGGIYGGATGYAMGGPNEAIKQSVSGVSPFGALAVQFVEGWQHGANTPGAAVGLWLDNRHPGSLSWTLALLMAGLAIGCLNAWHWVDKEGKAIQAEQENDNE